MRRRVVESWLLLAYFDWLMRARGFQRVHTVVRAQTIRHTSRALQNDSMLSHAMDLACVFYFKRVLCLQRSAALAVLLRRYSWDAELVIGAQLLPFQSHAWVEVEGRVVNDRPYITEMFEVLERC
ncbi:lasso peptide biosynthesis B2 protein [Terriglobus tenax]|uniref:lasso peptide biosynthesis B2 protein n=1 Tax=Terriglobus tenax TaxID=1111115 RepID=UPI0021DFB01F|nr:lasso peptide biosynthesis B2 protein [Terriglobus tenax]